MDPTTLLAIAVVAMSAVLIVVGIYAILIMRDMREAVRRANRILGRADSISEQINNNIVKPASSLAGVIAVLRDGAQIVHELRELSANSIETAKVIGKEAKELAHVAKEEIAPAVAGEVKEVVDEIAKESKEVAQEAEKNGKEVVTTAAEESKEVVREVGQEAVAIAHEVKAPEPMKARSLGSRRRFFSRKS